MIPMVLPSNEANRGAGLMPAALDSLVGSSTRKVIVVLSPARRLGASAIYFLGGSQSTQAPIAAVTARVLLPIHGAMTAPKPPAGPPAATTSRSSGDCR